MAMTSEDSCRAIDQTLGGHASHGNKHVITPASESCAAGECSGESTGEKSCAHAQSSVKPRSSSNLHNLASLFKKGYITEVEFKKRRKEMVDRLTGTTSKLNDSAGIQKAGAKVSNGGMGELKSKVSSGEMKTVANGSRPPPDFSGIRTERGVRMEFSYTTHTWSERRVWLRLDETPFARGGQRLVYYMQEADKEEDHLTPAQLQREKEQQAREREQAHEAMEGQVEGPQHSSAAAAAAEAIGSCSTSAVDPAKPVAPPPAAAASATAAPAGGGGGDVTTAVRARLCAAKLSIRPADEGEYRRDVEMQALCAHFAALFNARQPPRKVHFAPAWLVRLESRGDVGGVVCAAEPLLRGTYRKHNNNAGFVSEHERNTPQAFSHFTYEASAHTLLLVDIQGVGDIYTDPQIHTKSGREFGRGNLGARGMSRFLQSHRCNAVCRYLGLPPATPSGRAAFKAGGTLPQQEQEQAPLPPGERGNGSASTAAAATGRGGGHAPTPGSTRPHPLQHYISTARRFRGINAPGNGHSTGHSYGHAPNSHNGQNMYGGLWGESAAGPFAPPQGGGGGGGGGHEGDGGGSPALAPAPSWAAALAALEGRLRQQDAQDADAAQGGGRGRGGGGGGERAECWVGGWRAVSVVRVVAG